MASVRQYIVRLRDAQDQMAVRMGVDLRSAPKETRVASLSALALIAVLIKALVDKGVVTDAELTAAFGAAKTADEYDNEPNLP